MSEDLSYGDCRDSCIQYAIESDHACWQCADEEREEQQDEEW